MLLIEFNNKSKLYGFEEGAAARGALALDQHDQAAVPVELKFCVVPTDIDQEFIEGFFLPTALKAARQEIPIVKNLYGPYEMSLPTDATEEQIDLFRRKIMHRISRVIQAHVYAVNPSAADQSLYSEKTVGGVKAPAP